MPDDSTWRCHRAIAHSGHEDAAKIPPLADFLEPLREQARLADSRAAKDRHKLRSFESQRPIQRRIQVAPLRFAPDQSVNPEAPLLTQSLQRHTP